jgi:hypothetical protein
LPDARSRHHSIDLQIAHEIASSTDQQIDHQIIRSTHHEIPLSAASAMDVALGFKAHSGWAAMVALGLANRSGGDKPSAVAKALADRRSLGEGRSGLSAWLKDLVVIDRRRIELADPADGEWARQPYHAAEGLPSARAKAVVNRGITTARTMAVNEIKQAIARVEEAGHTVTGCAVLVGTPMPDWSVDEILAVHFRMHQAEGVLYRDVLIDAARACKLKVIEISEKRVSEEAARVLKQSAEQLSQHVSALKAQVGAPWGKDQKDAALAAMIALKIPPTS